MGLDMYLYKKTYVQNWNHMTEDQKHEISVKKGGQDVDHIKKDRISHIVEEVCYWRKFNALHAWFVENVQSGNDDCGEYYVSRTVLEQLLTDLERVLENHELASDILPTQSGFFFGSTGYDESYFDDVERTAEILKSVLAEDDHGSFYYSSSW